jgi:hypothetical protein
MKVGPIIVGIVALLPPFAASETLVTEAKILEVTERGFILKVGTEPLAVEDSPETRLWKGCSRTERTAFKKDDAVGVRIKTDTDPPLLREMADSPTWSWLSKVRKEPMKATVEKVEARDMTVQFADGKSFSFRISDKTKITLGGKISGASDLTKGMSVYVKGRLLPTLDTWLVEVSDQPIASKASSTKTKKEKPPAALPPSGTIEGTILGNLPGIRMFDLDVGRLLHITYRSDTKFFLDGKPAKGENLTKGQHGIVHYSRDKAGRILASKVELSQPRSGE